MDFKDTTMAQTGKPFAHWKRIHDTFKALSKEQQAVLMMRLFSDMTLEQIAEDMEKSKTDIRLIYEVALSKFKKAEVLAVA